MARRRAQGLSGRELSKRVRISQSKISRLENGLTVPTPAEIDRLVEALGGTSELAADWRVRADRQRNRITDARSAARRSSSVLTVQSEIGRREQAAAEIRIFQTGVVPGLLQEEAYARAILNAFANALPDQGGDAATDVQAAVSQRMRRQEILLDGGKTVMIVITESVLQYRLCPPDVMLVQLRKIRHLARLPTVQLGILPIDADLVYPPMLGFEMLDASTVWVDMPTTVVYAQSDADIRAYGTIFTAYFERSVRDIDGILDRYAAHYRRLVAETDPADER